MKNIKAAEARNKRIHGGRIWIYQWGILYYYKTTRREDVKSKTRTSQSCSKVICKGKRPNNFWITPIGSKGLPKQVNWRQLFDTGTFEEGLAGGEENEEEEEQGPAIPHYNLKSKPISPIYNLCPKPVPLPQKRKGEETTVTSKLVTHL